MDRLRSLLSAPGRRESIIVAAPVEHALLDVPRVTRDHTDLTIGNNTLHPEKDDGGPADLDAASVATHAALVSAKAVKTRLDRWLDGIVRLSGHPATFGLITVLLLAWAFCGISYSNDLDWQVAISDVQALLCLAFDNFLMRQQLRAADLNLRFIARLRSRNASKLRMLRTLRNAGQLKIMPESMTASTLDQDALPKQSLFGRLCTYLSAITGHFSTLLVFWAGIICWLAFGPSYDWSAEWQLYINSATSAMMVFVFAFLSCVRERHAEYIEACMLHIEREDTAIERQLRHLTNDDQSNPSIEIVPPKLSRIQRAIYYYADLVGTLAGIALLILVLIIWVALGPTFDWSTNWFLISGTYAGLVGLNDGFVLDNVYAHMQSIQKIEFALLRLDDEELATAFPACKHVQNEETLRPQPNTWKRVMSAFSHTMTSFCAHEYVPIAGIVFIIGLIAAASAMGWNLTGQLLCNIPPSIIETWWMMLLMNGHNEADQTARAEMTDLLHNRKKFQVAVQSLEA